MAERVLAEGMSAFLADCDALAEQAGEAADVAAQRRHYLQLCATLNPLRVAGVASRDLSVSGAGGAIPLRLYWREGSAGGEPLLLFLHGGGWYLGNLDSHDYYCARLAADTACRVLAVDYRLAPEHRYPAALEDAAAVLAEVRERAAELEIDGDRLLLCGDSAGANLCAALAARERDAGRTLAAQILIYPALGGDQLGLAAYVEQADAPQLSAADVAYCLQTYLGPDGVIDAEFAPLLADDFRGLPPTLLLPVELDPLRDDASVYAARLDAAGVPVELRLARGVVHGSLRALGRCAEVDRQHAALCDFVARIIAR